MNTDRKIVVVDVGCRWGFAERFISGGDFFRVYGFDPDEKECGRLNAQYASDFVKAVPLALAGSLGKRTLYLTKEPACSSLHQPDPILTAEYPALACATEVAKIEVQTTTLDAWALSNSISAIDFIKIDTQGTELEILHGAQKILVTVKAINVEVEFNPIYLGQPVFADVDTYLRSQGFVLWKLTNLVHYSRGQASQDAFGKDITCYDDFRVSRHELYSGQLYWADAHYVKKDLVDWLNTDSVDERRCNALLFDSIGMPDFAQHLANRPLTSTTAA